MENLFFALKIVAVVLGSYLLGNINVAIIISKLKKRDVRTLGSGNPGTMNMFRNYGNILGSVTLALDALKGALPCLIGWAVIGEFGLGAERLGLYIGGVSVIVGHIFPIFYKFHGGKGIASSIGVCMVAQPVVTLIMFVAGVLFLIVTKMGAVTSFIIISVPFAFEAFAVSGSYLAVKALLIFSLFALTFFAHRKNVVKLFKGTESKTVLFGKNKSSKKNIL